MVPRGISKLLRSTSVTLGNAAGEEEGGTLDATKEDMSEVLGLCSGAFPQTQTQEMNKTPAEKMTRFKKFGAGVRVNGHPSMDYSSGSESSEGGGEGGGELSCEQRQRKLTSMLALGGSGGGGGEEEDTMPKLTRKRKRKLAPKATKG